MIAELKTPAIERADTVLALEKMTHSEYLAAKRNLSEEMNFLNHKIIKLNEKFIDQSPFKIGDKVKGLHYKTEKQAFISDVGIGWNDDYKYSFNAIKKDGTMSKSGAGIYSLENMELVSK